MKRISFAVITLFSFYSLICHAQMALPNEEDVTLTTKEGSINGKLLIPNSEKSCPVVILIAGSGPTDMDGNSPVIKGKNNSLKYLAEGLAGYGIASLRFDKRGIASSAAAGKEESKLVFEDYVNDVIAWIDYLARDQRFSGISVAGHSEGSLIGMLACQSRPKVKGFVSLAGAGRPAYEILEEQVSSQPDMIKKEVASINASLRAGRQVGDISAYMQALFRPSVQPYLISWYKYNPQEVIASLKMPVLIIQGEKDIQVSVNDAELLKKARPDAELLLINTMNHVLKDCDTMDMQKQMVTYGDPALPVNAKLMSTLTTFVKGHR